MTVAGGGKDGSPRSSSRWRGGGEPFEVEEARLSNVSTLQSGCGFHSIDHSVKSALLKHVEHVEMHWLGWGAGVMRARLVSDASWREWSIWLVVLLCELGLLRGSQSVSNTLFCFCARGPAGELVQCLDMFLLANHDR